MKRTTRNESCEINFLEDNWMIKLGQLTTLFDRVIVKNFQPTAISLGFVRAIISDHSLVVRADDENLVLEKKSPENLSRAPRLGI